jgi:preprotein translocase subunit SecG
MTTFITVVHIITCVLLVLVVLIQSGKGAEISASFSGSSQTVFGSSGGANFFTHFTQGAAAVFFLTSLGLTILGSETRKSLFEGAAPVPAATAPAVPGAAGGAPAADSAPAAAKAPGAVSAPAAPQEPVKKTAD